MCLAQGHNAVTLVRLEPAAPWSGVKHSTTEPLCSLCFFCGSFLLFMFPFCRAFLSVHGSLVVTCWERAYLLALFCVMFYCVFVTFPCGVLGQVWYLIVLIPDLCHLTYMEQTND